DRPGGLGLGGELNEREPPGPPSLATRGQVDLDDPASLGQERGQSIRSGAEREIPNEDAGGDGWFLPCRLEAGRFGPADGLSVPLRAGFADGGGGPDLLGKQRNSQTLTAGGRARRSPLRSTPRLRSALRLAGCGKTRKRCPEPATLKR